MENKKFDVIYEDENVLVIDKPAGIIVFSEKSEAEKTLNCGAIIGGEATGSLIDYLLKDFPSLKNVGQPPRWGIVHRLDKDTSGILLVAKNDKTLKFLQKEFKEGKVLKKYLALVVGRLNENQGEIKTLIGRSPKNRRIQKAFSLLEPRAMKKGLRKAVTKYKVLEQFNNYTLVEAEPKTGRKHQIRCHFAYLGHPIASDAIYSFKNQPTPPGLRRQFLHASYLKIKLPGGETGEFKSGLSEDLKEILKNLKI